MWFKLEQHSGYRIKIHPNRSFQHLIMLKEKGADRNIEGDPLHVHFVDDEDEGLVPVGVQVAGLHACLLLLANTLLL